MIVGQDKPDGHAYLSRVLNGMPWGVPERIGSNAGSSIGTEMSSDDPERLDVSTSSPRSEATLPLSDFGPQSRAARSAIS